MRLILVIIGVGGLIMLGRFYSASVEQENGKLAEFANFELPQADTSADSEFSHFKPFSDQSLSTQMGNDSSTSGLVNANGIVNASSTEKGSAFRTSTFSKDRNSVFLASESNTDESTNLNLPANARNVRQLSRAYYELPPEAADLLKKFFSLDSDSLVETKVIGKETDSIVTFEVTTDAATQKSLGNFLLSIYPVDEIPTVDKSIPDTKATKVAVRSKEHPFHLGDTINFDAILE